MTYLHVDSEGKCLNNHDPQEKGFSDYTGFREAAAEMIARHKFRLVLPNSICDDYIVEKYSQTLQHATIPIFLGAPTGKRYDPGLAAGVHPAAIYVEDFASVAELTAYVVAVARNHTEYLQYFEWVGKTAPTWPMHFAEIDAKRQGATSLIQYACERTLDGVRGTRSEGGGNIPRNCYGTWRAFLFGWLGKNASRWQNCQSTEGAVSLNDGSSRLINSGAG